MMAKLWQRIRDDNPAPEHEQVAGTRWWKSFGAALVWVGVTSVLFLSFFGPPGDPAFFVGELVGAAALPASLLLWLVARRRAWSFGLLVLVALPFFLAFFALLIHRTVT